ncbi:MAG: Hpt domain-containing protein [Erysipelotrichaceae bacterium]
MKDRMEQLKLYGADIEGTMNRFLNDEDLYISCFETFLKDEAFAKLGNAIQKNDFQSAFDYAHTLKGVAGNMGLTPMYQIISKMVEELRNKHYDSLNEDYQLIMEQLTILKLM